MFIFIKNCDIESFCEEKGFRKPYKFEPWYVVSSNYTDRVVYSWYMGESLMNEYILSGIGKIYNPKNYRILKRLKL